MSKKINKAFKLLYSYLVLVHIIKFYCSGFQYWFVDSISSCFRAMSFTDEAYVLLQIDREKISLYICVIYKLLNSFPILHFSLQSFYRFSRSIALNFV